MSEEHTCGSCRFWRKQPGNVEFADCRRTSPRIIDRVIQQDLEEEPQGGIDNSTIEIATRFPRTFVDDWCGKYEPNAEQVRREACGYRIDREADAIVKAAVSCAALEAKYPDEPDWRGPLKAHAERLYREVPDMLSDIFKLALERAPDEATKALIRWAPLDNALEELTA